MFVYSQDTIFYDCIIFIFQGCADIHKLNLHGHVDGEEHVDGIRLPKDKGVLQGETWTGVPGI